MGKVLKSNLFQKLQFLLSLLKLNNGGLRGKKRDRKPHLNYGIPALPPKGGRPVFFVKFQPPSTDSQNHSVTEAPQLVLSIGGLAGTNDDHSSSNSPLQSFQQDPTVSEVLFENPSVETQLFVESPEEQSLTNVADKANLREGTKFVFGSTSSGENEKLNFSEEALAIEETFRSEESKLSQDNVEIFEDFFEVDRHKDEGKSSEKTSPSGENGSENSVELDFKFLNSLFPSYDDGSESDYEEYTLTGFYDEYLEF